MAALAVALLASSLPSVARAQASPCDPAALAGALSTAAMPVVAVVPAGDAPGLVAVLATAPGSGLLLYVAVRTRDGALVTRALPLDQAPAAREAWLAAGDRAVDVLDAADLRGCPSLQVDEAPEGPLAALESLAAALRGVDPAAAGQASGGLASSTLQSVVNVLALVLVLAYLALAAWSVAAAARASPRDALWGLALVGLALAVRAASGPRAPVGVANADLSHVVDIRGWERFGTGLHVGVTYPPAWRMLLLGVFRVTGPSWDVACWMTTIAGALVALPAFRVGARLGGSRRAGILAGLVAAAYPLGILFSNGIVLETAAGLFLALSFAHLLAWMDGGRPRDGLLWALSLVLFAQTRLEGLGALPVVALAQVALVVSDRGARGALALLPWAAAGVAAAAPFLVQTALLLTGEDAGQVDKAGGMALPTAGFAALAVVLAWDAHRRTDPARRDPRGERLRWTLLAAVTLLFAAMAVWHWPGNALWPEAVRSPLLPGYDLYVTWPRGRFPDDRAFPGWLVAAGVFPLPWLLLWFAALAPSRPGTRLAPAPVLLALLPWYGYLLTRHVGTGIAPVEGLRHHGLYVGLVAMSVGLGADRLAGALAARAGGGRAATGVAMALAALAALSPLATHHAVASDLDFDSQREFAFARRAAQQLPAAARILVADDTLDYGPDARIPPGPVDRIFRSGHLWIATGWLEGRELSDLGAFRDAAEGGAPDLPVYWYQGLECWRSPVPGRMLPSCTLARDALDAPPVATARFPNRPYAAQSADVLGIRVPEVDLALVPVSAPALERLRRRLAEEAARQAGRGEGQGGAGDGHGDGGRGGDGPGDGGHGDGGPGGDGHGDGGRRDGPGPAPDGRREAP